MEEKNFLRNKVRGLVEFYSPDPLKPFLTGCENTERIASLNSLSQVLNEPVNLLGLISFLSKITPVDPPYTPLVSTAIGSNWCASARPAYLWCLYSSVHLAEVPGSSVNLFRCAPAKVSTHVQFHTKRLLPLSVWKKKQFFFKRCFLLLKKKRFFIKILFFFSKISF